jgi:Proteasome complex subunit Rpn13 ubiquitin receptor
LVNDSIITMTSVRNHFGILATAFSPYLLSFTSYRRVATSVEQIVFIAVSEKMASGALFGNTGGRSQSKHLLEFRAGKMALKGKMVYPDKRKGMVYIYQSDDSLMHFCWRERSKNTAEDVR